MIYLPEDAKRALQKAYAEEISETGKTQLKAILDNIEFAEKYQAPKDLDKMEDALIRATRRATVEVPIPPNAVDPSTQKNSEDNRLKCFALCSLSYIARLVMIREKVRGTPTSSTICVQSP